MNEKPDIVVDPELGWKYGFPKLCPGDIYWAEDENVFYDWLEENGFPKIDREKGMRYIKAWIPSEIPYVD